MKTHEQLGLGAGDFDFIVALAGNPNTGKSTVFNALTGLRQHTGNWPGKTVTRAEGVFRSRGRLFKLVDLPGTYSLLATSTDEEIARDFILFGRPACVLVVVDATSLERNLNLVLQVLEITDRVVVILNLIDEAEEKAVEIDVPALSDELGVVVVPAVAKTGRGMDRVLEELDRVVSDDQRSRPYRIWMSGELRKAIDDLVKQLNGIYPDLPNPQWVAMRLLDGDPRIREALLTGELGRI